MIRETESWITFLSPGSFIAEEERRDCSIDVDPEKVEWPENAYAFYISRCEKINENGVVFSAKSLRVGPTYYHPESTVMTFEEVKADPSSTSILISNMRSNRWDKIVKSRWGNYSQPFNEGSDVILGGSK